MSSRWTRRIACIFSFLVFAYFSALPTAAATTRVVLREQTLQTGYTVRNSEGTFAVGVPAGGVKDAKKTVVKLHKVEQLDQFSFTNETLVGDVYGYKLHSDAPVQLQRRLWLQLSYPSTQKRTVIKYWNAKQQRWIKLQTRHDSTHFQAFAQLKRRAAVVGVFARRPAGNGNIVEGIASWYNGTVAASNAFPMGSTIRVTNVLTGQSIETVVGSTWSADVKYGWLLDLPRDSFAAIANISTGLIHVTVEVIST